MRMLKVLPEVVCAEEFLGFVAFTKFVHVVQMIRAYIPLGWIGEFFAAITTSIHAAARHGRVESRLGTCERSTRPGMPSQMQ